MEMVRVRVSSPERLGPSYKKDQILNVTSRRAERWVDEGIVSLAPEPEPEPDADTKSKSSKGGASSSRKSKSGEGSK